MSEIPPGGKRGSIGVVFVLDVLVLLELAVPEALISVMVPDPDADSSESGLVVAEAEDLAVPEVLAVPVAEDELEEDS